MTSSRRRHRTVAPALAAGIALTAGCSALLDTSDPLLDGPCSTDGDCPALETCVRSVCQATCAHDSDCATGESCQLLREARACLPVVDASVVMDRDDAGVVDAAYDASSVLDATRNRDSRLDGEPEVMASDAPVEAMSVSDGGVEGAGDVSNADAEEGDSRSLLTTCADASLSGVVLFGGQTSGQTSVGQNIAFLGDTWEFVGGVWTQLPMSDAGPPVRWAGAATSICNGMFVFSGGNSSSTYLLDQWIWQQNRFWSADTQSQLPPERVYASIAALNGKFVLFGGYKEDYTTYGDTWVWDGSWTLQNPSTSPPRRAAAATATVGDVVVVFGGDDGSGDALSDTWVWNGSAWSQVHPSQSPPGRYFSASASVGHSAVVFGGFDGVNFLNDTWTWDGVTWAQQHAAMSPTGRQAAAAASNGQEVVLFGGQDANGVVLGDTWAWSGTSWTQLDIPGPSPRMGPMMSSF